MVAEPDIVVEEPPKMTVVSREEVLKFIPHGEAICGLDRAWYDDETANTVYAEHTITEGDCEGHFENERFSLLICPLFRILEWLGQLTILNGRLRFGVRAEIGAFQQLSLPGLETFLVPGDRLVMRSRIIRLELESNGSRGGGSAEVEACWDGYLVVPKVVFDFSIFGLGAAERLIQRRKLHLRHRKVRQRPDWLPLTS